MRLIKRGDDKMMIIKILINYDDLLNMIIIYLLQKRKNKNPRELISSQSQFHSLAGMYMIMKCALCWLLGLL